MKSIQLTEEHRFKLLEMCKELFKYDYFEFAGDGLVEYYNYTWTNSKMIHWFEFVMTHLIEKLSELNNKWEDIPPYVSNVYSSANGKWNLYTKFHFHYPKDIYKKHPIDYLYEQFKLLK